MALFSIILFLVEFVRGAALISFIPIYGEKALGLSLGIIGIAITAHYVTDTALKMFIGYLLDRFSVRFVVHTGLFISFVGLFLIHYASYAWVFIVAAAIYGIGISPIWIVCLTKVSNENRATQMGLLYTIWLIGLGAGPVAANFIMDVSYAFTFWLLVGLSLLAWFLSLRITNVKTTDVKPMPMREQFSLLFDRLKQMKLLLPGMVLQTLGASMLVPILPGFAEAELGLSSTQYSYLLMAGGGFTVLGLIPMGRLSDALGKKWFLVLGFGIFGFGLYSIATAQPGLWISIMWAVVLGISYAAVLPAWNALLAYYVPPMQQGLGWGIFSTVEGIGVMIGPALGGVLASWYGTSTTVLISAILFAVIGVFYIFFPFEAFKGERNA
ncbi:MFS transporter [Paenibacillus swuensis]|uniref:MFS transporter n=2 Tax=Paenibacillus swuensis TaxID=1178515 RepID=A0A172TQ49_9BACL|nr:MFS transporter [Paenibacillus swuensis]